jgi:Secretion system C-terminal sorting domain/PGAP1-like protein/Fibronectin type III domain
MYMRKIVLLLTMMLSVQLMYAQTNQAESEGDSAILDRYDYEFDRIKDPALGYVPGRQLLTAKQAKQAMQAQRNATASVPFSWTERGPRNDVTGPSNGNTRPGMGGTSGRVRVIWEDLSDPTGETVWVGSASGGLWRGTNITMGTTWTPVNDLFDNLAITAFCQDPVNKDILFFGTGEKNPSGDAVKGGGIWRSIDHGVTWGPMAGTENYGNIARMACDAAGNLYVASVIPYIPNQPAGTKSGVYRYLKLSFSWADITPAGLSDLVPELELSSTGRLHVSCGFLGAAGSGYRYTDNPATVTPGTWTAPVTSFPTQYNVDIASKGDTLYALAANVSYDVPVIYKSTNGGANWGPTNTSPPTGGSMLTNFSSNQGWYCIGIAVDPTNGNKVIAGSLNCYRTVDGGNTWSQISNWVGTTGQYVHADQHVVTWRNNNQVLIGSDGGVHYSGNGGTSILDRNLGLRIKQFYSVAVHPTTTDYFLGGTQDNGVHQLTAPGMNISTEVTGGDGGFVHIDQDQPQFQWGSYTGNTFYRSLNGGSSWTKIQDAANNGRFINPSDYDDLNNILYCAGNAGTYVRWENPQTGTTFTSVNITGMGGGNGKLSALKVSPYSNNTVYLAASTYPGASGTVSPRLVKATNAHATPTFANIAGPYAGIASATVSCVELGTDENHIILSLSNYGVNNLWVTTNGGTNWAAIDGNLPDMPVRWAMFYPGNNTKAIIATETGIWQTAKIDGTNTVWEPEPDFPNVRTDMMQYRRNDRLLVVATHGRGIFTTKLKPDSVVNLKITTLTNTGATISWDSTADALNYDVDYKLSSASSWTSFAVASTDTFAVLTGLTDNTAYDIRVRANWGPGVSSNYSDTTFTTIQFAVTAPNTTTSVQAGATIPVTWIGNTAALSPNVKISLSTNGGLTYPLVLQASTANDNSEQITLPNIASPTCRIKIESIDTVYFFDVSDTNFIMTPKPIDCPKLDVQVYKRDTSFTSIASDDNGFVYAGTQTRGLFRFENNQFKNYSYGLNGLIPWKRTWIRQMQVANNQLWVAHSGYVSPIGVEVDYFRYGGVETINVLNGPGDRVNRRGQRVINVDLTIAGPPTRNTMGVLVDTLTGKVWTISDYADSVSYPELYNYTARYWYKTGGIGIMNPGQTNFFRNEQSYPAPYNIGVGTNMAGAESNSIGKRKGNGSITATATEILTTCRGYQALGDTLFKPGIMRYNRFTGAYIGKYDQTNTGLPFGLTNTTAAAPAIYTDAKNRVWLALGGNRLAVMDTSGWHYIGVPTLLAGGGSVQPNAISGDRKGVVYIGTDAGLLVFNNNKDTSGVASYTKDSSYCLYTMASTANKLPSNYIRGTHVDRSGNVWLATGSGVCKLQLGDLMMYNLLPQPGGNYITTSEPKRTAVAGFDPEVENSDTIRIAADGSQATLFKWQGKDPAKLKAIIKEGNTAPDFGSLTVVHRSLDSFIVQYKHPEQLSGAFATQGKRDLTLQLFDTTFIPAKLIIEVKYIVVRPPILCLHGIWSSGEMYNDFKRYLIDSAGYRDYMVGTPSYPNDKSFTDNQFVARNEAANLLLQCADNNFSAGKVDIVSHSMGGILSRIFLQSTAYEQTINKLITVNTPHAGSQLADLVRSSPALTAVVNNLLGNNTENGGMDDLRVTQDGIRVLLNGAGNLNRNKVPSHAITSRYTDLQVYEVLVDAALTFASYIPALGKIAKVAKLTLAVLKYAAYSGTTCNTNETVHECLRYKIYEDDNDLAVALGSQRGGLPPSAISYYDNYSHNSIMDQSPVFNRLNFLLKAPNNDAAFTTNGYNPPVLNYNASLRMPASPSTETVDIVSPVTGAVYAAGQSITVDIVGSNNIQKHLVAIGNETLGAKYYNSNTKNFSFSYPIPLGAIGKIYLVAIGFDNLGKVTYDTAFINVGVPVGVTLDSIRIVNKRNLKVYQTDSLRITINAYYSDTVREISNMPGVAYVIDDVNVRASTTTPNYIIGLLVGYDFFRATWQGKTDTGYIQVLEKPLGPGTGVIPVTLTSFTGKLVGNAVQLKWNTAQEINASHFEVERSADGINFSYIGQVKAVGQSNANTSYGFNDLQFKTGANYYRLKQVDMDGRFTYSIVVLIRVKKDNQPDVLIFPNPAQKQITVNVTEGQHSQWNLQVQNMVGQPVLRHIIPANQNNERITIDGLAKGVYTVTILSANGEKIYNGKLVVQ